MALRCGLVAPAHGLDATQNVPLSKAMWPCPIKKVIRALLVTGCCMFFYVQNVFVFCKYLLNENMILQIISNLLLL